MVTNKHFRQNIRLIFNQLFPSQYTMCQFGYLCLLLDMNLASVHLHIKIQYYFQRLSVEQICKASYYNSIKNNCKTINQENVTKIQIWPILNFLLVAQTFDPVEVFWRILSLPKIKTKQGEQFLKSNKRQTDKKNNIKFQRYEGNFISILNSSCLWTMKKIHSYPKKRKQKYFK